MSAFEDYDAMRIRFRDELEKSRSKETKKTYEYCIRVFGYWLEDRGETFASFSRDDVQIYLDSLTAEGKSAATVNKVYNAIKSFSRFIQRPETTEDLRVVKPPNIKNIAPKSLRRIERLKIIEEVKKSGNLRNIAIVHTLLNTGVRVEELTNINRNDILILENEGELRVRRGKGNKERELPLNKEAREAITKYLSTRTDKDPALFLSKKKRRLGVRGVQHVLQHYGVHPHRFRHTFITEAARKYDLVMVQQLSGHESTEMVARYSKASKEDLQRAVEDLYH